ncbi:MAG: TatD family hydrolase [Proteobacteria bacterium]|nr:TatD family hydrolase [Pseudomonadota bacterium]
MDLIDTHCHIDVAEFDTDRAAVLRACRQQGVTNIVVPAIQRSSWDQLLALCEHESGLHPALGLHPLYLDRHSESDLEDMERYLDSNKIIAVGEIGLDYYKVELDRDKQQFLFEAQLAIALKHKLPVLLHVRKAHDQVLATLKRIGVNGGIAHAFNGSLQQAHHYIDMGLKLGFGGTMTYAHSSKIRRLAKEVPLESIVLETDAPDMTVASHHGERNSPAYLPECLSALAEIRHMPEDELANQLQINTSSVLALNG